MYKLERKAGKNGNWYEDMLSPFKTIECVISYHEKYSKYYPDKEDKKYRVTNLKTGLMRLL